MMVTVTYIHQKLKDYKKALKSLKNALIKNPTELERDGAIQRFEYCYELSWKILKHILTFEGNKEVNGPRSSFTEGIKAGYISSDDEEIWYTMLDQRNLSVHTYNETLAISLFNDLPRFYKAMKRLLNNIIKHYSDVK